MGDSLLNINTMSKSIFLGYNNVTTGVSSYIQTTEEMFINGMKLALRLQKKTKPDIALALTQVINITKDNVIPTEIKAVCLQATIVVCMIDDDSYCKNSNLYVLRVNEENKAFYLSSFETTSETYEGNKEIFLNICSTDYDEFHENVFQSLDKVLAE